MSCLRATTIPTLPDTFRERGTRRIPRPTADDRAHCFQNGQAEGSSQTGVTPRACPKPAAGDFSYWPVATYAGARTSGRDNSHDETCHVTPPSLPTRFERSSYSKTLTAVVACFGQSMGREWKWATSWTGAPSQSGKITSCTPRVSVWLRARRGRSVAPLLLPSSSHSLSLRCLRPPSSDIAHPKRIRGWSSS
jgi:hypothetical protein